jgi:TldD protein
LDEDIVVRAVNLARDLGCTYSEARLHKTETLACLLRDGTPEPAVSESANGIGIRVLYEGALGFCATNIVSAANLNELIKDCVEEARAAASVGSKKISFVDEPSHSEKWNSPQKKKLANVGVDEILRLLKEIDNTIKDGKLGVSFPNRFLVAGVSIDEKTYANSDGSLLRSSVGRCEYFGRITAVYEGKPSVVSIPPGFQQMGGTGGWEVMENLDLVSYVPQRAEDVANALKSNAKPPKETIDVVLGPEVAGLASHESSGHPEEADRVLGREAAQAGESYLKPDTLGVRIGSSEAYVSDDPTIEGSMGFYLYDDEGVKARKRRLIEGGVIKELLQNRATAMEFGTQSNGSARAVQFDREPIIRMANTFVEPGDFTPEELIKDVKHGIYIKSFMEWNIDDKRLNGRYVGLESFIIRNGEVKEAIRDPVLEITTPKFWGSIDARANDLKFTSATCGKGDPMQGAPVWTGGPHIRLRGIRVSAR